MPFRTQQTKDFIIRGHTKQKIIVLVACMVLMQILGHVANSRAVPAQGVCVL